MKEDSQLPLLVTSKDGSIALDPELIIDESGSTQRSIFEFAIVFSFIKLILSIFLSLYLSDYWKSCAINADNENYKCTATSPNMACTTQNGCFMTTYSAVGAQCKQQCYFGGYSVVGIDDNHDCYGYVDRNCLCDFWSSTTLVVICLNIIHFMVQLVYFYSGYNFNPQMISFHISAYGTTKDVFMLLILPRNCLLSFIEISTIIFAWLPLVYGSSDLKNSITCDDNGLRSQTALITTYYQPILYGILITLMESYKANIQCVIDFNIYNDILIDKLIGLTYLLRLDIALYFGSMQLVQSIVFALSLLFCGFPIYHIQSGYSELKCAYEQFHSIRARSSMSGGGMNALNKKYYEYHWKALGYSLAAFLCILLLLVIIITIRTQ